MADLNEANWIVCAAAELTRNKLLGEISKYPPGSEVFAEGKESFDRLRGAIETMREMLPADYEPPRDWPF